MIYNIITIFPELIKPYLEKGIISKLIEKGIIGVNAFNLRDYTNDKHKRVDEPIFGTGKGMLFTPEPLENAISIAKKKHPKSKVIFLSPSGVLLNNKLCKSLAKEESLILISARYEGIDQRIIDTKVDMEVSIGDYVLTGGELPALILIDSISRFIEGGLEAEAVNSESFEDGLVEHGHYTEPLEYKGMKVPDVIRSGNHKEIDEYRRFESLKKTYFNRHELLLNFKPEIEKGETKDKLKTLKKENKYLSSYLKMLGKITKEYKDVRRNKHQYGE